MVFLWDGGWIWLDIKEIKMNEFEKQGTKSFLTIIDGFAQEYADVVENRSISEANRLGKEAMGRIISYMDLSDEELTEKSYSFYPVLVESILNWDKEKTWSTAGEIKSIHQAAFHISNGDSKEALIQIYHMMD